MMCPKCGGKLHRFEAAHECEQCKNRWFIINTFEPRPEPKPKEIKDVTNGT